MDEATSPSPSEPNQFHDPLWQRVALIGAAGCVLFFAHYAGGLDFFGRAAGYVLAVQALLSALFRARPRTGWLLHGVAPLVVAILTMGVEFALYRAGMPVQ